MGSSRKKLDSSIANVRKERRIRNNRIIFFCIVSIALGYYILNYIAAMEKPPMGATFNILLGCIIIAVAGLICVFTIKKQYFPKKRKRSHHVFLDEINTDEEDKAS